MGSYIHRGAPLSERFSDMTYSCYIENKNVGSNKKGRTIPIMFSPSSISDTLSTNYNQQAIPGGSAPVITYSGTGARVVSIDFFVPIDYLPPNTEYSNTEEYLNAIRALSYPKYVNSVITPPNCMLHLPNLEIDGVCTQCSISYDTEKGFGQDGAIGANVSLSIMEVLDKALSDFDVYGKTTIIGETNVKTYEPTDFIKNNTGKSGGGITKSGGFTGFSLNGSTFINTDFVLYSSSGSRASDTFRPRYEDEGYRTNSNGFTVVSFYFTSVDPISFTGSDIIGENGKGKSSTYKICINGESYNNSNRVLSRNVVPTYTRSQLTNWVAQMIFDVYIYYIYVPYVNLNEYLFDKAQIRTLKVKTTGYV